MDTIARYRIGKAICVLLLSCSAGQADVDFARDILPVLSDHCFACHGPDANARQANLRLDERESAFGTAADSGQAAIVAGDAAASHIIQRLLSDDESERMPPPEADKRPTAEQIELLRDWIDSGAAWSGHWAFEPPVRPTPPAVERSNWVQNPIDQFVLAKIEQRGWQPAAKADKVTLVRRLHLDLIGLPPTSEEVDTFLNDTSHDAYESLVDRLLASPRYGEHMATFWLDAARFADTNGYQNDFRRSMWLWRDWVINAYNQNMPFDQFTIEQLAGDMLPDATLEQKVASGFNRNHRTNTEGGAINEEWLVENVVDRLETTATVFLGLTMGCARCHDHKYDPISQQEFYEFFSYFYNVDEQGVYTEHRGNAGPMVTVETDEYKSRLRKAEQRLQELQTARDALRAELSIEYTDWVNELIAAEPHAPDPHGVNDLSNAVATAIAEGPAVHTMQSSPLGNALAISQESANGVDLGDAGQFELDEGVTISAWVQPIRYGAIVSRMDKQNAYRGFDVLINPDGRISVHLIHHWPNNATKITTEWKVPLDRWTFVAVHIEPEGHAENIAVSFDLREVPTTTDLDALDGSIETDHPTWVGFRGDTQPFAGQIAQLRFQHGSSDEHKLAAIHQFGLCLMADAYQDPEAVAWRTELQHQFEISRDEFHPLRDELAKSEAALQEIQDTLPSTMVMKELDKPRQAYVLERGQYDRPDKSQPVSPGVPELFRSRAQPSNRMELAKWLVNGNNALTARVAMNHFWTRYFGIGLLETPENFGVQSPPPSHPALLDWLATEFVSTGWDVKAMQKLIVTSATYRQASSVSAETIQRDPKNRMLARGARFRLPAEAIRDNALAISGLLVNKLGGPSVKPYQPEGLWEELAGGAKEPPYIQATDEDLYRRSLYTYRKRTVPHPTMSTFDGTSREICFVARSRTNTPLQALALLNDATYVEAARALAAMAMQQSDSVADRITFAFRRSLARRPNADEMEVLLNGFHRYLDHFNQQRGLAAKLLQTGQYEAPPDLDALELAALATVCNVILNLDETITRE